MQKLYIGVSFFFSVLSVSAQETLWQKDIESSTQDFLSTMSTTLDRQIVLSGSAIQKSKIRGLVLVEQLLQTQDMITACSNFHKKEISYGINTLVDQNMII